MKDITKSKELLSELYWRNIAGNAYADVSSNAIKPNPDIHIGLPIFKNTAGKRLMLDKDDQVIETHRPIDVKYYVISQEEKDIYPISTPCIKVSGEALCMDGIRTDNRFIEMLNPKFENFSPLQNYLL